MATEKNKMTTHDLQLNNAIRERQAADLEGYLA